MNRRQLLEILGRGSLGIAISQAIANPVLANESQNIHWGYIGEDDPQHWGEISPDFQRCQIGHQQSPINLGEIAATEAEALKISYQATPLKILNNGHTIQVNYQPGSFIIFKGEKFELLQFHFHHPSEHQINGQPTDLEVHFVHRSDQGKLAVLGVLAQVGSLNASLKPIWQVLPQKVQAETAIKNVMIDANEILPSDRHFYEYSGSLTTPPCSEGVLWLVMAKAINLSADQIDQFASIFSLNARPVQPLDGRQVLRSI
jgi:carbonic anhydrase